MDNAGYNHMGWLYIVAKRSYDACMRWQSQMTDTRLTGMARFRRDRIENTLVYTSHPSEKLRKSISCIDEGVGARGLDENLIG